MKLVPVTATTPVLVAALLMAAPPPVLTQQPAAKAPPAKVTMPAAIDAAFRKAYPTAIVKAVSKEKEGGKDVYEVESVDNGKGRDLIYTPDGTVVEVEEELRAADVPSAVAASIAARYPKATITKREKVTRGGDVSYEVQLKGAGVGEAVLSSTGKWIEPKQAK
jgi:Peptidase propeptide and YPEB domain